MKASVFKGNGILSVEEVQTPKIRYPDEVLVRVKAASICGSDLHILSVPPGQRGDPGTIMGHEFVAEIVKTGEAVTQFPVGMRVVIEPNIRCGICPECRSGRENLCRNAQNMGQWRDGGFAEYCVVPQGQLHAVPKGIPDRVAALAEPLACVMNGMMRANPMPHEKVMVFGAGAIGLIFIKLLKCFGVMNVAVCEMDQNRQREAIKCGADHVLNPAEVSVSDWMTEHWGEYCDLAVDAVGAGAVLEQAVDIMKCGGRILVFGQNMTQRSTIRPGDINQKELTVYATLSTKNSFPPALELMKHPALKLEDIISHEICLTDIEKGIGMMRRKEATKIIVYPE